MESQTSQQPITEKSQPPIVENPIIENPITEKSTRSGSHWWVWVLAVVVLLVVGEVMLKRAEPILKGRVIETLSTRFNSRVELDDLQVSLIKGLAVSGKGLPVPNFAGHA